MEAHSPVLLKILCSSSRKKDERKTDCLLNWKFSFIVYIHNSRLSHLFASPCLVYQFAFCYVVYILDGVVLLYDVDLGWSSDQQDNRGSKDWRNRWWQDILWVLSVLVVSLSTILVNYLFYSDVFLDEILI